MNETLKNIANEYSVDLEQASTILEALKVKNINNPGKRQIEGFGNVCRLLKDGISFDEAIASVVDEAKKNQNKFDEDKQEASTAPGMDSNLQFDLNGLVPNLEISQEQLNLLAEQQASSLLSALATAGYAERRRVVAQFLQLSRQKLENALKNPEFEQHFTEVLSQDIVPPQLSEGITNRTFILPPGS